MATIEADQVLDLLFCRKMPPAVRKISPARHVRESDDAAVVETERKACHLVGYVASPRSCGKPGIFARVSGGGLPSAPAPRRQSRDLPHG